MVEGESLSEPTIYIPRQLIAKYNGRQLAHLVPLPVLQLVVPDIDQVLLEQQRDLGVGLGAAAEPPLHHLRRHFAIPVPFVRR